MLPNVCMVEDIQALGVGGHDAVLNTIVDHLDEVASAIGSTAEVALLGSSPHLLPSRCTWCCMNARSQSRKDRVEMLNYIFLTANHQTIATLESPDASTRANVNIMN